MTVLILHGVGGHAGIHWQDWLKKQLEIKGHSVIMPDLPESDDPDRATWQSVVDSLIKDVDQSKLIIVGHSLGVPTALDVIESSHKKIHALVSVAGFHRDYGADVNAKFMSQREINLDKVTRKIKHAIVYYSDNDPYVPQKELQALADGLDVKPTIIPNGGHLNANSGYDTFPQLLESIQSIINKSKNANPS